MRIATGSDHAGFALKEAVKVFLSAEYRDIRLCGSRRSSLARQTGRARHSALRERRLAPRWPFSSRGHVRSMTRT